MPKRRRISAPLPSTHYDIYPLGQSTHRENKNCGIFATFLRLGAHFHPHKAKTGRHETDLPALSHLNPWLESSEQSLIAKKSRFLFLDSRSSFNMTIWSGRTQRSIASGFAAASVSGNRTLRSVGRAGGAYRTAWRRSGGAYCTAWRLLWAPPRPPLLSPRAKENLPSLMLSHQLKKWEAITVEKPPVSRSVCRLLCATYAQCAVHVPHGGG